MADRPQPPTPQIILNNILERERALERRQLALLGELGGIPLQTFEDGQPLGDTRFLNFGPGVQAVLTGDGFVTVSAIGPGGDGGWDAIVDSTLTASDPGNRLFLGIGEALSYLAAAGLSHAYVLVRFGTYTETANWTNPRNVFLFGQNNDTQSPGAIDWNLAGFGTTTTDWTLYIEHFMRVSCGATKNVAGGFWGTANASTAPVVYGYRCQFAGNTTTGITFAAASYLAYCDSDQGFNYSSGVLDNCDFTWGGFSFTIAGGQITLKNCRIAISTFGTVLTVPPGTIMQNVGLVNGNRRASGVSGSLLVSGTTAGGTYDIDAYGVSLSLTDVSRATIKGGQYPSLTLTHSALASQPNPSVIEASIRNADITGPAVVSLASWIGINPVVILRGTAVVGTISRPELPGFASIPSNTFLQFIGAKNCNIIAGASGVGNTGTYKPYAFDAASALNILDFAGASTFPVAGTDAGVGNLIRVT